MRVSAAIVFKRAKVGISYRNGYQGYGGDDRERERERERETQMALYGGPRVIFIE